MAHFTITDNSNKSRFSHNYSSISSDELANKVHELLTGRGYSLKTGEPGNGAYVKGNRVARILLGAFYKYFKWNLRTSANVDTSSVSLSKESSGMSGGLIGMNQVKNELATLSNLLQTI